MNLSEFFSRMTLSGVMAVGALVAAAEEPIITFHTNVYDNTGETNAFHFYLGAKEPTYVDIDCGFGSIETEVGVATFDPEAGGIAGTVVTCTVSAEGIVKIYGDASKIDYIDMEGCYISDISFPQMTEVEILNLSYNELKGLDLSHMSKLQALYLNNNPFSESPLLIGPNKPDLTILNMSIIDDLDQSFNLSDYPSMRSFEAWHVPSLTVLDPTGCPNLLKLSADYTNISSIDLSQNPNLLILNVSDTKITELDLSHTPYLTELYCGHMAADFSKYPLASLDLSGLPNLQRLFCQGNALTTLDVSCCPKLTDLYCSHNLLTEINIDSNPDIVNLNVAMNLLTFSTLPMPRETFIEYLYYQQPIAMDRSYAAGTTLDLSGQVLREGTITQGFLFKVSENDPDFPEMLDEEYFTYTDGKITLNKAFPDSVQVTFINDMFQDYPLSTSKFLVKDASEMGKPSPVVDVTFYPTIKNVSLSIGVQSATPENPVSFFVDFGNGELSEFSATSTDLPETPNVTGTRSGHVIIYMPENADITALGIADQRLINVDLARAATLQNLTLTDCSLSTIDLTWNRCLRTINLSGNNLSALNLEGANGSYGKNVLETVIAGRNRLNELTFNTRSFIKTIDLSDNQFTDFDLLKFTDLKHLDLSGNRLTTVDFRDLESIEMIDLSDNNLSEITLLDYLPLQSLNISGNHFTFGTLPAPGSMAEYIYAPQQPLPVPDIAPSINLSANYAEIDGAVTEYDWVMDATGEAVPAGAITVKGNGLFVFSDPDLGLIRCNMTHPAFPDFKDNDVMTTTPVQTASMPAHVFANFTTIEDGTAELTLTATRPRAAVYIDWEGEGYLEQYVLDTTPQAFTVNTKAGTEVKCYSYDENDCVKVFSLYDAKLSSIDASGMMNLIHFSCCGASLKSDDIKLPACHDTLEELSLTGNDIESIDLSNYTAVRMLNLSQNKLTSFDATPFKKAQVLYLANNNLTSVTLDNPVMWECALNGNQLENVALDKVPLMRQLYLSDNRLSHLDISAMPALKILNISFNYFTFATLPLLEDFVEYGYANQAPIVVVPENGYKVDLSSQASCYGSPTTYTWYIDTPFFDEEGNLVGENLYEGEEYTITDGVTTFLKPFSHIMCVMTNPVFPNILLYTDFIDVTADPSGIEETAVTTDLPATWYNLSGAIVARTQPGETPSLAAGIYIRVTAAGARKVLVD